MDDTRGDGVSDGSYKTRECLLLVALGVALFLLGVGAGRSLSVHRLSLPFSSACPLNPPLLSPSSH